MQKNLLWPIAAVLLCAACSPRLAPRTAEIARPGELTGDIHLQLANVGVGQARVSRSAGSDATEPGDVRQVFEESGALHQALPLPWAGYLYPASSVGQIRLGLFDPCEVGPILSPLRLGGEARCGLLSQSDGAPVSMALAAAVAHQTLIDPGGPWWQGGVDVSSRSGRWQLMTNLHLSYGTQLHAMKLDTIPDDAVESEDDYLLVGFFGDLARVGPWARVERDELRLSLGLGVGWQLEDSTWLSLGLVPSLALETGETHHASCANCASLTVDSLDEVFSLDLIASIGWTPEDDFTYDPQDEDALKITGWVLLGGGYVMFVGPIAIIAVEAEMSLGDMALLLIPVAGPFLWRSALDDTSFNPGDSLVEITVYGMGATQATGALFLTAAYLFFDGDADAGPAVIPGVVGSDAVGVTTQGRF